MVTKKQRAARRKFAKMAKARARKMRQAKIRKLSAELRALRRKR